MFKIFKFLWCSWTGCDKYFVESKTERNKMICSCFMKHFSSRLAQFWNHSTMSNPNIKAISPTSFGASKNQNKSQNFVQFRTIFFLSPKQIPKTGSLVNKEHIVQNLGNWFSIFPKIRFNFWGPALTESTVSAKDLQITLQGVQIDPPRKYYSAKLVFPRRRILCEKIGWKKWEIS